MKLLFISGLSGSGKSVALDMLEDLGHYCIDNLPIGLLGAVTAEALPEELARHDPLALGIDARAGTGIRSFPSHVTALKKAGIDVRLLFLEAADEVLMRRYSETRRKHPLSDTNTPLAEAITRERELLQPLREHADLVIDTSRTNLHQLRDTIRMRVHSGRPDTLSLLFQSFGFKYGIPEGADFVFDVRCLPNPHWLTELRSQTGLDEGVVNYLESMPEVKDMLGDITAFLEKWLPSFLAENRAYVTVAVGCTGGNHRSVYLVERLARHFRSRYEQILVRHVEMP